MPVPGPHLPWPVDDGDAECNHNYMSTRQDDPQTADAAGTGSGEDSDAEPGSDRGAGAAAKVRSWFAGRLAADWFAAAPDIQVDREEITIVGTLDEPGPAGGSEAERAAAAEDRIRRFREETRSRRIEIAREAEHRFRRKVSWGVTCGPQPQRRAGLVRPADRRERGRMAVPAARGAAARRGSARPGPQRALTPPGTRVAARSVPSVGYLQC